MSSKEFDTLYRDVFKKIYRIDYDDAFKRLLALQRKPDLKTIDKIKNEIRSELNMIDVCSDFWHHFGEEKITPERFTKIRSLINVYYHEFSHQIRVSKYPKYLVEFFEDKANCESIHEAMEIILSTRIWSLLAILIWLIPLIEDIFDRVEQMYPFKLLKLLSSFFKLLHLITPVLDEIHLFKTPILLPQFLCEENFIKNIRERCKLEVAVPKEFEGDSRNRYLCLNLLQIFFDHKAMKAIEKHRENLFKIYSNLKKFKLLVCGDVERPLINLDELVETKLLLDLEQTLILDKQFDLRRHFLYDIRSEKIVQNDLDCW
ncbi:hypothetical protein SSS_07173 [Sarcoptes scabiei]|uniref:Uncharacterized protein n=1 Tax=Sarcoptes scabiei TaxID=52283 RepID=A0A834RG75_SARSC|nr:hypothetical protein SSS_00700 [Sarcoptes scabiei]KAF7496187.1 hypothetical protein SSS_07173 [Sarcoptes scabiei]